MREREGGKERESMELKIEPITRDPQHHPRPICCGRMGTVMPNSATRPQTKQWCQANYSQTSQRVLDQLFYLIVEVEQ